jgi:RimJ/RimL family protein N-acetyltransferase
MVRKSSLGMAARRGFDSPCHISLKGKDTYSHSLPRTGEEMLKGESLSLRAAEKEDADTLARWFNDPHFSGDFQHFPYQIPGAHIERRIADHSLYGTEWVDFIASTSEGDDVGWIAHYTAAPNFGWVEIGVAVSPEHRGRGYASEAVMVLTDYLFLSRDLIRVQAVADKSNVASLRVFEKAGFVREGILRKSLWNRDGTWGDGVLLSILREDWGRPKMLVR